jgi:hypothetical protein
MIEDLRTQNRTIRIKLEILKSGDVLDYIVDNLLDILIEELKKKPYKDLKVKIDLL